ncbi:MAG: hypothetical protein ACR2H1_02650, partial [Limisphaerales bacterium]
FSTRIMFPAKKAPEDGRSPRLYRDIQNQQNDRQVLDCGSPLPLFPTMIKTNPQFQLHLFKPKKCRSLYVSRVLTKRSHILI